jgi:hypothetical protein
MADMGAVHDAYTLPAFERRFGDRRAPPLHDKSGLTIAAVVNGIQVSV